MKKKNVKWLFSALLFVVIALMVKDSITQEGISDLSGGFKEVAFVRNEQNKGGIVRIYAFTVTDTSHADYLACGNLLPHNEYGSKTMAYFFPADAPFPTELRLDTPHFDSTTFNAVVRYVRDEQGIATVQAVH